MKSGKTLTQLAQELERQSETRKDYVAPQGAIHMEALAVADTAERTDVRLFGLNGAALAVSPFAHKQVADDLGIPTRYYERMLQERPALLVNNVNTWLEKDPRRQRLVRTLDGRMRAWLSDSYRPLDNYELAEAVLPVLQDQGTEIVSTELTETRLYIKATFPRLQAEVKRGDIVQAGVTVSNSEVGNGALRVEPFLYRLICLNGAIMPDSGMKKYHLGQRATFDEAVREILSDRTKRVDDAAFWMKVQDVVRAAFQEEAFRALVDRFTGVTKDKIESDNLAKVVEVTVKRLGLPEGTGNGILKNLAAGGDLTRYGLLNAITATANTQDDYETATLLERAGGEVIELKPTDWKAIAEAA